VRDRGRLDRWDVEFAQEVWGVDYDGLDADDERVGEQRVDVAAHVFHRAGVPLDAAGAARACASVRRDLERVGCRLARVHYR
jgi:hypothetical protein